MCKTNPYTPTKLYPSDEGWLPSAKTRSARWITIQSVLFGVGISIVSVIAFGIGHAFTFASFRDYFPQGFDGLTAFLLWPCALVVGGYSTAWKEAFATYPRLPSRKWNCVLLLGLVIDLMLLLAFAWLVDRSSYGTSSSGITGYLTTHRDEIFVLFLPIPCVLFGALLWWKTCPKDLRELDDQRGLELGRKARPIPSQNAND